MRSLLIPSLGIVQGQLMFPGIHASGTRDIERRPENPEENPDPAENHGAPEFDITRQSLFIPSSERELDVSEIPIFIDSYNNLLALHSLSKEPDRYKLFWYTVLCEISTNSAVFDPRKTCAIISNPSAVFDKAVDVISTMLGKASEKMRGDHSPGTIPHDNLVDSVSSFSDNSISSSGEEPDSSSMFMSSESEEEDIFETIAGYKAELERITSSPNLKWMEVSRVVNNILYNQWWDLVESSHQKGEELYSQLFADWSETETKILGKLSESMKLDFARKRLTLLREKVLSGSLGLERGREEVSTVKDYDDDKLRKKQSKILLMIDQKINKLIGFANIEFEKIDHFVGLGFDLEKVKEGLQMLGEVDVGDVAELIKTRDEWRVEFSDLIANHDTIVWNDRFNSRARELYSNGKKYRSRKILDEWKMYLDSLLSSDTAKETGDKMYDTFLTEKTMPMFESDLEKYEKMDDLSNVDIDDIVFMGVPAELEDRKQALIQRILIAKQFVELKKIAKNVLSSRSDLIKWKRTILGMEEFSDTKLTELKKKLLRKIERKIREIFVEKMNKIKKLIGFGSDLENLEIGLDMLDEIDVGYISDLIIAKNKLKEKIVGMMEFVRLRSVDEWNSFFISLISKLESQGSKYESYKVRKEWRKYIEKLAVDDDKKKSEKLYDEILDRITIPLFEAELEIYEGKEIYDVSDLKAVEDMVVPDVLEDRRIALVDKMREALGLATSAEEMESLVGSNRDSGFARVDGDTSGEDLDGVSVPMDGIYADPDVAEFRRRLDRAVSDDEESDDSNESSNEGFENFEDDSESRLEDGVTAGEGFGEDEGGEDSDGGEVESGSDDDDEVMGTSQMEDGELPAPPMSTGTSESSAAALPGSSGPGSLEKQLAGITKRLKTLYYEKKKTGRGGTRFKAIEEEIDRLRLERTNIKAQIELIERRRVASRTFAKKVVPRSFTPRVVPRRTRVVRPPVVPMKKVPPLPSKKVEIRRRPAAKVPKDIADMSIEELARAGRLVKQELNQINFDLINLAGSRGVQDELLKKSKSSSQAVTKMKGKEMAIPDKLAIISGGVQRLMEQEHEKEVLRSSGIEKLGQIRLRMGELIMNDLEHKWKEATLVTVIPIVNVAEAWNKFLIYGRLPTGQSAQYRHLWEGLIKLIEKGKNTTYDLSNLKGRDEICTDLPHAEPVTGKAIYSGC